MLKTETLELDEKLLKPIKRAYYTIATGEHLKYYEMMKNSLRKFTDDELILFSDNEVKATKDSELLYRATPYFARQLFQKGYTELCKVDADSIVTGNLDHIWEGEFDVGVVFNANPKEHKKYPVSVWNIHPLSYVNNGLVVLKSPHFVDHWFSLCYSQHFNFYQMREQDLLNILVFYGDYTISFLDNSPKWHGLRAKGYYPNCELRDGKIILPKGKDNWPDEDKEICVVHWAGGHDAPKMNYRTWFPDSMHKHFDWLVKP